MGVRCVVYRGLTANYVDSSMSEAVEAVSQAAVMSWWTRCVPILGRTFKAARHILY